MSQGASGGHRWRTSVGTASTHGSSLKAKRFAWTALTILLGAISLWLLLSLSGCGKPFPSQVVAIGMTYDNPVFRPTPFLLDSTKAFDELRQRDESKHQFVESKYPPGTKLDGSEVLTIFQGLSLDPKKENLLVYLNLQGGVLAASGDKPGAVACFLTLRASPDSLSEGAGGQRVLVQELLKACSEASAANVIVLLEAGEGGPNWRAGSLNRDFAEQLKKEVEQAVNEYPKKLRVIGAVSGGEVSQGSRAFDGGVSRSVFCHFAVQGLLGEADDWRFDPDTGKSARGNSKVHNIRTVSFDELFAYLHGKVGDWSRSHRAASQTVWRFPESGQPLDLAQINSDRVRHAKAEPKSASKDDPIKSNDKDSSSPSKESPKGTADEKGEKKSVDSAESDSSKKPEAEPTKNSPPDSKSAAEGDGSPKHADLQRLQSEKLRTQLTALWTRRDTARNEGLAVLVAPREWRRLQLELVHVEQSLRGGDALERVKKDLQKAEGILGRIVEQVRLVEVQRQRPATELLSLGFFSAANTPAPIELTVEKQKQFAELLKLAFPASSDESPANAPAKPALPVADSKPVAPVSDPPEHKKLKELLVEFPQLRVRVWNEVLPPFFKVARLVKTGGGAPADFLKTKPTLLLAEELTKNPAGRSTLPVEAVSVFGVIAVAEAAGKEQIVWTPDLSRACGHLVDLRERFEQFAARDAVFSSLFSQSFAESEIQLMAAERWVQVGQSEHALQTLGLAESALATARKDAEILRRAAQLKANVSAELPDLARWVARQQEANGKRSIQSTRKELHAFAKVAMSVERNSSEELTDLRNLATTEDASLFGLFDVIEQCVELFRLTGEDVRSRKIGEQVDSTQETRMRDASTTVRSRLKEIGDLTNRLEQSWNEWHSFDHEVELLLAATTPSVEQWTRLQEVLLVPWIPSENRQRLLKQVELLDQPEAPGGSVTISNSTSRGDWQAFWAIETLRLAGLDAKSEEELWDKFAKSLKIPVDSDDTSESFVASATLGYQIAKSFLKVKENADWVATDVAARQHDIELSRREQLTRGVDPADVPDSSAQAEFVLARQLVRDHSVFIQIRAGHAARNARLEGNLLSSHWVSMAERLTRLSDPASNPVPAEESPFTLGTIANEQLFWTRGEPAEITIPLVVSLRPGMERPKSKTIIRVLDAEALKVEPAKLTQSDGFDLEVGDGSQEIKLTIQKPKNITATESVITIALIDKTTQLPWDVRRLTLRTPLKDQDWRIEFRAKGELTDRNDSVALDRNGRVQRSDKYRSVLWLPTKPRGGDPLSLQPVLIPPPESKIPSVSVRVFELDEKGMPRPTPSGKQDNIPMNRDGLPIALNLAAAPAAAVPPAAANPKPAETAPAGKEVSRGWIFEILPAGEPEPIKQQIIPRVRPPLRYFNPSKIQVTFRNGELKFELQRRTNDEEVDRALRPQAVRVKLELPKALDDLRTDNDLVLNFERDEKKHLLARFNEQQLSQLPDEAFVVSVNVGGWPRAFPYKIVHGQPAVEFPAARPVIVAPATGFVIEAGKKLEVDVQIDSERLNSFGLDEPWKLASELVLISDSDVARRPAPMEISRSLHESIWLINQGESEWQLAAEVRNHRVEFDTEGLRGRFTVRASATPSGNQELAPGSGDSEPVKIGIAESKHTPPQPKLTVASLPKIRPGTDSDLLVPVSAADPQAGIVEIAAGFDLDKDEKLSDAEIFKETTRPWSNPLNEDERRVTLRIAAARLKDLSPGKKHTLLVRCKNGVNKVCEDPLPVPVEVDQARGWIVVKVSNDKASGNLLFIDGNEQKGGAKNSMSYELPVGDHEFQLINDLITSRKGGLKKVLIKQEHTQDNPASVTLDPPAK